MINMAQAVYDYYAKEIKRSPCYTNRASGLGYFVPMLGGCVRRGVYERTRWQEKEMHDGRVQLIFEEGNRQEQHILIDLAKAGIQIIEQQSAFQWPEYELSGHIDGTYIDNGEAVPVEIKSMNPNIFSRMHTIDDFDRKPWTRAYKAQMTVYMLMKNIDRGVFILKDKSNGTMRQVEVILDYDLGEACLATCERINAHVKENTIPDRIDDRDACLRCPYKHLCLPDLKLGEPLRIVDDPMFEERVDRYIELDEAAKECKTVYNGIRDKAIAQAGESGELNMVIGKYHLIGKRDARGAFRMKIQNVDEIGEAA